MTHLSVGLSQLISNIKIVSVNKPEEKLRKFTRKKNPDLVINSMREK
jgi:hypothetical protein